MKRRPGKRVEVFRVETKLNPIDVEIRTYAENEFCAVFKNNFLVDRNLDWLKRSLCELGRAHDDAQFESVIEYRLYREHRYSVGLTYQLLELSVAPPGQPRLIRKFPRDAGQEGTPESELHRYFPGADARIVSYTPERLAVIQEIQAAVARMADTIAEYLDVADDALADSLDWLYLSRLASRLGTTPKPAE